MSAKESFSAGQTREFFGDGDFFRLLQTTGPITVEFYYQGREVAEMVDVEAGYAESFARDKLRFDRIRIYSATAQDVKWVIREGSDVRYDRGAATITGNVDLNTETQNALTRPKAATGSWKNTSAVAANTPIEIIAPGANINGVVVLGASASDIASAAQTQVFIAKNAAPATIADGEVIAQSQPAAAGSSQYSNLELKQQVFIPAGLGLYFISNIAGAAGWLRACRFQIL